MLPSTTSRVTTDHEQIRRWAEARGARPAAVAPTENDDDPGIIRLEFPGDPNANGRVLEEIGWDEWFQKFDENNLALLYQEEVANGDSSSFNKIISRETAEEVHEAVGGRGRSAADKLAASTQKVSGSRINGSGRKSAGRPEGRAATAKRSTSARGRTSSGGRASTHGRSGEKRQSNATRGGASRGSKSRHSRTTSRTKEVPAD